MRRQAIRLSVIGGVCGLAWAAGLRGFMAQIAGPESAVEWGGTFGFILPPGVIVGALLGLAEHRRRKGNRRGHRLLLWSPMLLAAVVITQPGALSAGGLGGGALAVPLFGIAGGYALSGRGPIWGRALAGLFAVLSIPMWALTVTSFAGAELAIDTPRGAWVALYFYSYLAVLAIACTIPLTSGPTTAAPRSR